MGRHANGRSANVDRLGVGGLVVLLDAVLLAITALGVFGVKFD